MGIFRSEKMGLYWLKMPRESAYDIVSALGRLGCLQFIDADEYDTPHFGRHFHSNVKRCDEILNKIHEISIEVDKFELDIQRCPSNQGYLNRLDQQLAEYQRTQQTYFEELETFINKKSEFLVQLLENFQDAVDRRNEFIEQRAVLNMANRMYQKEAVEIMSEGARNVLSSISGTIDVNDQERFRRTIFRVSKGSCLTLIEEINPDTRKNQQLLNSKTRDIMRKSVFIILFSGSIQGAFRQRLQRVCESFSANVVDIPDDVYGQGQKQAEVEKRIIETNDLVKLNENELDKFFKEFTQIEGDQIGLRAEQSGICSKIEGMRMFCVREKLIYQQMNLLSQKNSIYEGLVWIQSDQEDTVMQKIYTLSNANPNMAMGSLFPVENYNLVAPTFTRTNEFTRPFQEVVDTYGQPRYQELNPGLYTCVTFPFLFGVMFGDIGHGSILLIFGVYMMFYKPTPAKPGSLDSIFPYRYLIVLMGFMATYCGLMYNDFFGMQLNLFGTCYSTKTSLKVDDTCTYPFGVDPIWGISSNKLVNYNSLKMKLAVILGISQMIFGLILRMFNSFYFKSALDFFFEFIPMLVFISCTFGYMCFMIFVKWTIDWSADTSQAPSILTAMLKFFLNMGAVEPTTATLYEGQADIQFYLLIAAVSVVPFMLLPKPLILNSRAKKALQKEQNQQQPAQKGGFVAQVDEEDFYEQTIQNKQQKKEDQQQQERQKRVPYMQDAKPFSFSEEFVHQVIETIEFVLGCVSHTASYLRLWALSLAHSQLSEVFFAKTMTPGLESGNPILIVLGFIMFANVTFGVLMCMDAMECFLHTLRLHWVEFQSKFFKADGYRFEPFCYITTLESSRN